MVTEFATRLGAHKLKTFAIVTVAEARRKGRLDLATVLLVTEDASLKQVVENACSKQEIEVLTVNVSEAVQTTQSVHIDALILDDAAALALQRVRQMNTLHLAPADGSAGSHTRPIDEVLVKPVPVDQLEQAILRVSTGTPSEASPMALGELELDPATLEVRRGGATVMLTPVEFRLLRYLGKRKGQVATKAEILHDLWDLDLDVSSARLVRSHISNLRAKLLTLTPDRGLITTVPRKGYRLL
jgi:two-component system OmpR family response regulator